MNHEKQQINSTFPSPSSQSWTILPPNMSSSTRFSPWNVFGKLEKGKPFHLINRKELGRYSLTLSNSGTILLFPRSMWRNLLDDIIIGYLGPLAHIVSYLFIHMYRTYSFNTYSSIILHGINPNHYSTFDSMHI